MPRPTLSEVYDAFDSKGFDLWIVGGSVRDELLAMEPKDIDLTTNALPDETEGILRGLGVNVTVAGKKFGTIGARLKDGWVEVTTYRKDEYNGGRWPDVEFGTELEADLRRRDFSINAIAKHPVTGKLVDPFLGKRDINMGIIRTLANPCEIVREDPLRILRAARFRSQLGFVIEGTLKIEMGNHKDLIQSLSQERVTAEFEKLLIGKMPVAGIEVLRKTGVLQYILPELLPAWSMEQNHWHKYDVWHHIMATVEAIELTTNSPRINLRRRWAALLHDIGKPEVRHRRDDGEWGFNGHQSVGASMTKRIGRRMKIGKQDTKVVELLVRRHMDRPELDSPRQIRRFIKRLDGHWEDLLALKAADNASHAYDDTFYLETLKGKCARMVREEEAAILAESPLNGYAIMALAPDRKAGPWIAEIKSRLSQMILDGQLEPGNETDASLIARKLVASQEDG